MAEKGAGRVVKAGLKNDKYPVVSDFSASFENMQAGIIDTHAHIYLPEFATDRDEILARARAAGIEAIYLPAIDSTTHKAMLQTETTFSFCKSMIGLHPCSVKEAYEKELEIVSQYLLQRKFIALGIVLLLQCIHSRQATDECIEVVKQYPGLRGVFHCFSGSETQARQLMELGFYLGIGGVVTFKNAGLDKVVQAVGLSHVVLETDAPYLAPVPHRGKRNEPAYTRLVAEKLSGLLETNVPEIEKITTANAKKLFRMEENP